MVVVNHGSKYQVRNFRFHLSKFILKIFIFLIVNGTVCGGTIGTNVPGLFSLSEYFVLCSLLPFFLYNLSWSFVFCFVLFLTEVIILVKQSFMRIKSWGLLTFCEIFLNNS